MTTAPDQPEKEPHASYPRLGRALMFLDDMKNVNRIVYALYALCAVLFLLDFTYKKKTYFDVEYVPGFYALYGFFLCAALVVGAKMMRLVLKRREDYYAPRDVEAEEMPRHQTEELTHDD